MPMRNFLEESYDPLDYYDYYYEKFQLDLTESDLLYAIRK